MRLAVVCAILGLSVSVAHADMGVSFQWGQTKKCFDRNSPPMTLSGVPAGTVQLDIRMTDLDAPNYNHGGGRVKYAGQTSLSYGAFRYKGPCPPSRHTYQFTVRALDARGKTLATARARRAFP
ncbi:phospholipid-binding protein [Aquibium sp. A9E412]|uniref:phospholipid-binding protein n=1 Tax=Aquibium sp. A9E412 TaxID=2976767 RepID=UPI0025B11AEB|nr:phospholipid-binding protein [Aquibium sp. A9E412]MDN2568232.1 phospholipid-binding protein [Aquibium sp. A9E412]